MLKPPIPLLNNGVKAGSFLATWKEKDKILTSRRKIKDLKLILRLIVQYNIMIYNDMEVQIKIQSRSAPHQLHYCL